MGVSSWNHWFFWAGVSRRVVTDFSLEEHEPSTELAWILNPSGGSSWFTEVMDWRACPIPLVWTLSSV